MKKRTFILVEVGAAMTSRGAGRYTRLESVEAKVGLSFQTYVIGRIDIGTMCKQNLNNIMMTVFNC
jgi:hypothetical protein